jgi:ATP-binding cassette subfamily B protein
LWLVIGLQAVQALAGLFLPTLNSDIINNGVVKNDIGYIWRMGGVMLLVTLSQVILSVAAVYFGSKVAMGFGRDVRRQLFSQVNAFSTREVAVFGAPSLITRVTFCGGRISAASVN